MRRPRRCRRRRRRRIGRSRPAARPVLPRRGRSAPGRGCGSGCGGRQRRARRPAAVRRDAGAAAGRDLGRSNASSSSTSGGRRCAPIAVARRRRSRRSPSTRKSRARRSSPSRTARRGSRGAAGPHALGRRRRRRAGDQRDLAGRLARSSAADGIGPTLTRIGGAGRGDAVRDLAGRAARSAVGSGPRAAVVGRPATAHGAGRLRRRVEAVDSPGLVAPRIRTPSPPALGPIVVESALDRPDRLRCTRSPPRLHCDGCRSSLLGGSDLEQLVLLARRAPCRSPPRARG